VRLELLVPDPEGPRGESPVTCDGVVVRVEPEIKDESVATYNVAIFFTLVPESSQKVLNRYIRARISS
jgi:hypothetical protein